jgi:hypothetical protein
MIDFKPVVDALVAQLIPQITDAVVARLKAEGTGTLALEPGALVAPMKDLVTSDNEFTEVLSAYVREEARDVISDGDYVTESDIEDQVSNGVRDYLREHLDDAIDSAMGDADFVRDRDIEDHIDLENFELFTDLRDEVESLKRRIDGEQPDTPSPFYNEEDNRLRPEFVQAVRDALQRVAAGNSSVC